MPSNLFQSRKLSVGHLTESEKHDCDLLKVYRFVRPVNDKPFYFLSLGHIFAEFLEAERGWLRLLPQTG